MVGGGGEEEAYKHTNKIKRWATVKFTIKNRPKEDRDGRGRERIYR